MSDRPRPRCPMCNDLVTRNARGGLCRPCQRTPAATERLVAHRIGRFGPQPIRSAATRPNITIFKTQVLCYGCNRNLIWGDPQDLEARCDECLAKTRDEGVETRD